MNPPSDSRARRRLVVAGCAGLVLVLLVALGIYGMVTGPHTAARGDGSRVADGPGAVRGPQPAPARQPDELPTLPNAPHSTGPEMFARNVATTLFAWNTSSGFMPLDYASVLLEVGDPSGAEQAGLAADLAAYLPSRAAWLQLRKYATRQHLTIRTAFVPRSWASAVAQARPGQLAPGTLAYTVEGVRHRAGVWNDERVTSAHAVAFTLFIVCAPTYESCHLLRLSQLDKALR